MITLLLSLGTAMFQLDENAYFSIIERGDRSVPWVIMFHGDNCPACHQALPEFQKAAEDAKGIAKFALADTARMPNVVNKLQIKSIPTFMVYTENGQQQYQGPHTAGGIINYISEIVGDGLQEVDEAWVDSKDNMVLHFAHRFKPPPLFSAAFGAFKKSNITFAWSHDSDVIESFGRFGKNDKIPLPSTWFFKDGKATLYKGKRDIGTLIDAIAEHFDIDLDEMEL